MVVCVSAGGGVQHPVREEEQGGVVLCVLPELRPQILPHPGRLRHPLPVRDKRPDADLRQLCHVPGTFPHAPVSLITSAVARLKQLLQNVAFVVSGFAWSLKVGENGISFSKP